MEEAGAPACMKEGRQRGNRGYENKKSTLSYDSSAFLNHICPPSMDLNHNNYHYYALQNRYKYSLETQSIETDNLTELSMANQSQYANQYGYGFHFV
jgi:hypothetical protein